MRRDEWKRVDELFAAALERDSGERAAYLDAACADDASLRREVDRLLSFERGSPGFLDEPAAVLAAALLTRDDEEPHDDSSASIDEARFVPGDAIAGRYRIVGLLGRGGMGEVYRADDLTLRQPVALKFLPPRLASRPAALARMRREVRFARQIAHRSVCRVYDVGEDRGLHFISMELVRGEDLRSLLRRVGRLTPERATDVARQLCAGLGAIHERGLLHRDLKPGNVLVDERGDARIADFGLASLAEEVHDAGTRSGTPAYMSPEQLAGDPLTVRSDLYSLGLVLYELFTGRRAFEPASTIEALIERREDAAPARPSALVAGLDRLVDEAIMRCLDPEPERRPESALAVAVALSGGDPLAAAIAAGEIPSPEAVAAAPRAGALRPRAAAGLALAFAVAFALVCVLSGSTMLHRRVPLPRSDDVLEAKAEEVLARLGVVGRAADDTASGFAVREAALVPAPPRSEALAVAEPPVMVYWYRRSPAPLDPHVYEGSHGREPLTSPTGTADVTLDTRGRLRSFAVVPPRVLDAGSIGPPVDWAPAFADAGLDVSRFAPAEPVRVPDRFADARFAWTGVYPESPEVAVRVEATSLAGRPVSFEVLDAADVAEAAPGSSAEAVVLVAVFLAALAGSLVLAVRNLRAGRGDRRGAARLALVMVGAMSVRWAVVSHHVPALAELGSFAGGMGLALALGAFVWLVYVALEPFVRRRWPDLLVSWSRLVAGGVRDPLVGRDALVGMAVGAVTLVCLLAGARTPEWLGLAPAPPIVEPSVVMLGIGRFPEALVQQLVGSVVQAVHALFVIVFVAALTRRRDLAAAACWLIAFTVLGPLGNRTSPADWWSAAAVAALLVGVLSRVGLLALIAALFVVHTYVFYPITTDLTAWYAGSFVAEMALLVALAAWAFWVAVAGQPLFAAGSPSREARP